MFQFGGDLNFVWGG